MKPLHLLAVPASLLAAIVVSSIYQVDACAPAARSGVKVSIADESAVIIWHEATKTEHFVRRASFTTDAQDIGFLVPTPSQPELGEASDEAFSILEMLGRVPNAQPKKNLGVKGGAAGGKIPPPVVVLDEKRVAGQDVVVLKATDGEALAKWLKDHGYDFSPTLKDWVQPYIDSKWIITASKLAKDKGGAAVKNIGSSAVRMSFKTETPFFPYREPADQRDDKQAAAKRLLRVFFIGTGKVEGAIGEKGRLWPGAVVYSDKLSDQVSSELLRHLKLPSGDTVPTTWHLTTFEDRSSPRPGTDDVYFRPVAAK